MNTTAVGSVPAPKMVKSRKTTVAEHGDSLLIGQAAGGTLSRDMSFKPWRMREEREIAASLEANNHQQKMNAAEFASMVLGAMCPTLAGANLADMKPAERRLFISQLFMGDVLYAFIRLRIHAMGSVLTVNTACRSCGFKFPFDADLNTMEVTVAESLEDTRWTYDLKRPLVIRGKKVERILFGAPRWQTVEATHRNVSNTIVGARPDVIAACFLTAEGVDGGPVAAVELDEMSKLDMECISAAIDRNTVSPDFSIEMDCPSCKLHQTHVIDWHYGPFFMASSG